MLYYEKKLKRQGFDTIIGIDEVGRGCLAGAVVAAAVCLTSWTFKNKIDDSKRLSSKRRTDAFPEIMQKSIFGLGMIKARTIDRVNILVATKRAMEEALKNLIEKLDKRRRRIGILLDGNLRLSVDYPVVNIIKGDAKSKSIACASILAKVVRDHLMSLYDLRWPEYGFSRHKGYGTVGHRQALCNFGSSVIHRLTFSWNDN
ncbi:MAG: ribonuclease HII [Candidatus Omnitrophica bacterium]|nr:ribonuclease HII [Candidatus Omnitrophota bacterium]